MRTRARSFAALTIIAWMVSSALPLYASAHSSCSLAASCCVGKMSCPMKGHSGASADQCHGDDAKPAMNVVARHFTLVRSELVSSPVVQAIRFAKASQHFGDFVQPAPDPPPPRLG
jgi:hypothetical protein